MNVLNWLEHHLLKCPYKSLTGIDCPGCGIQRSFLELLKGNFIESLTLYPALLPILFTFLLLILHLKFKYKNGAILLTYAFIATTTIVLISYIIKVSHLPFHR